MVVVTFTWRHDGCQVLLCGSFDGWSEQILVNLVEGSAVVFQRIVDVPPGYHDYKFLVDGIWQVDQDQICVQDEYGAINNLVIVKESVSMPSVLLREDDQLKLVSGFASNMHLEVFALDTEVAVQQAFHIMYEQRLAVMPLWDERSAMISGMLTASDFILILLKLQESHPMLTNNELEMHTVSAWKYGKLQLHAEVSGAMVPPNRRLLQVLQVLDEASRDRCRTCTRFDSLYRIMELLSDPTVRRVVVIDPNSQHLEGIITLTDVFNLLLG